MLRVSEPSGPADVYYSGLSLSDLGEAAQENIAAWFEARGVLYDEQALSLIHISEPTRH